MNREPQISTGTVPPAELCDLCLHPLMSLHCELICINCGFRRDCSDP